MLIGGEPLGTPDRIAIANPARPTETVGTAPRARPEDAARAVAAAKDAQTGWARRSRAERAARLAEAFDHLDRGIAELAPLYTRENGKTLGEATGELKGIAPRQRLLLELSEGLDHPPEIPDPRGRTFIAYRPYGVVLSIVPWNAPVSLGFAQVTAALVCGNAVVVKPPETCPLTLTVALTRLAEKLPPGLINVVTGEPAEIGATLTGHPDIRKIGFTGSVASASRIIEATSAAIKSLTLELGGNDAAILLPDAVLDEAALGRIASAAMKSTGQICMAIKRLYVPRARRDEVVEGLSRILDDYIVGNGLDPATTMGPLHSAAALERARSYAGEARRLGSLIDLGRIDPDAQADGGHFLPPMLATDLPDEARLVAEEQFSPILPVLAYDDEDEAVTRANASAFGLGGSVWGSDIDRATRLAGRLEAGTVFVNVHGTGEINRRAPYGGCKTSGLGRKSGLQGLLEYVEMQTITVRSP